MTSIYRQVHDLFAASHWTKGSYCHETRHGDEIKACYCLVGGFEHIAGIEPREIGMGDLLAPVLQQIPSAFVEETIAQLGGSLYYPQEAIDAAHNGDFSVSPQLNHDLVVAWNDDPSRTKDEVLAALAKADAAVSGESA